MSMNFLFIIQGEGRGHMTQALALKEFLEERKHGVSDVFIGRSRQREVPGFVYRQFSGKMNNFYSPNFIRKKNKKGINLTLSFIYNLFLAPLFLYEVFRLSYRIRKSEADIIVNFYDLIAGLAYFFSFSSKKFICISHHYYYLHPSSVTLPGNHLNKLFLKWHSRITSLKADKRIALSFQALADYSADRLFIAPPILRKELFDLISVNGERIVIYLLNEGFLNELFTWAKVHPDIFLDIYSKTTDSDQTVHENIRLMAPDSSFLTSLASCRALVCTAGFESVCEAAYLGKQIIVWPSEDHFEQELNALDAEKAGLAIKSDPVDMDRILQLSGLNENKSFKDWLNKKDAIFEKLLFGQ